MVFIPVASMGDIAFLLIIFFLLCSHFAKDPGVPITPATTPKVEKLQPYPIVVLIDAKGRIYFQGEKFATADQVESGVRELTDRATTEEARTVLFRCDRSVRKHVFEPVIEAIAKGGGRIAAVGEKSREE